MAGEDGNPQQATTSSLSWVFTVMSIRSPTPSIPFDDRIYIDKIQEQLWHLRHSEFAVSVKKSARGDMNSQPIYQGPGEAVGHIGQLSRSFINDVRSEIKRDKNSNYAFLPDRLSAASAAS